MIGVFNDGHPRITLALPGVNGSVKIEFIVDMYQVLDNPLSNGTRYAILTASAPNYGDEKAMVFILGRGECLNMRSNTMSTYRRSAICTCCLLFSLPTPLIVRAQAAQAHPPVPADPLIVNSGKPSVLGQGVDISADVPRKSVVGQSIWVILTIINRSNTNVICASTKPTTDYGILVRDERGNAVPRVVEDSDIDPRSAPHSAGRFVTSNIPPGRSLQAELDITKLFRLDRPGGYSIVAKRLIADGMVLRTNWRNWDHPELQKDANFVVQSDPSSFRLVAPPGKP